MKKGSILIFTLWVLIILAILSIMLSRRATTDMKMARYESRNMKAYYLAKAGVIKMIAELIKDKNAYDSLGEDWNTGKDNPMELILGDDRILYGASDEMARLNLNICSVENLEDLGIGGDIAEKILKYKTRHDKKFEFMEELFLIEEGMTRDDYSRIKDLVTIYRGFEPRVNINTASETVLRAVIEDEKEYLVPIILEYRRENDGIFEDVNAINGVEGLGELDENLFTVKSDIFRIWAQSILSGDEEITKEVEAVINRNSPGKFLHWKEY